MAGPDWIALFAAPFGRAGVDYMVTGATAAILYGQPRTTNDLDLVLALPAAAVPRLLREFPEDEFYVPPVEVILAEAARPGRGHFNFIHHETGLKADCYLAGRDPLHAWALPRRRLFALGELTVPVAPPEYVILRKLEFFREGGAEKHLDDIRAMLARAAPDAAVLAAWIPRLGLEAPWARVTAAR